MTIASGKKLHKKNQIDFFQLILILMIILSIMIVLFDSVSSIKTKYRNLLEISEMIISIFFSIEYLWRIFRAKKKLSYICSFFGIIDLISIIPFYLSFINFEASSFLILRSIRILRVFRIFKLAQFLGEETLLKKTIISSIPRVLVFLLFVSIVILIFGSLMYLIEGEENGFSSIPKSIYWAIVTMTTVGYGDIAPKTIFGQLLSSIIMLVGYGIIAVPTGLILNKMKDKQITCHHCQSNKNLEGSNFCGSCGKKFGHE